MTAPAARESTAAYKQKLNTLAARLKRGPMTARQISEAMDCCRPAAYQRLRALQERGEQVYTIPTTDIGRRGPKSLAYGIR